MLDMATVLTAIFTYIDDFCKAGKASHRRSGPAPEVSDSEILTVACWCELVGIASEHEQVRYWKRYLSSFFPKQLDRSRYHRRRSVLAGAFNEVRIDILSDARLSLDDLRIIDSTPVPVMHFRRAGLTPLFPEASYGYCAAKRETYFGFKLHLLTDRVGIPVHFDLSPANIADVAMAEEILGYREDYAVLGDKGYVGEDLRARLFERRGVELLCPKRANQREREPKDDRRLLNAWRQRIEVVNAMLKDRFHLGSTLAKSLKGLVTRISAKMTAFLLGIFVNRLFGREPLSIAEWAF